MGKETGRGESREEGWGKVLQTTLICRRLRSFDSGRWDKKLQTNLVLGIHPGVLRCAHNQFTRNPISDCDGLLAQHNQYRTRMCCRVGVTVVALQGRLCTKRGPPGGRTDGGSRFALEILIQPNV